MIVYKRGCERKRRMGRCGGVALPHFDWLVITLFSPEAPEHPSLSPSLALFSPHAHFCLYFQPEQTASISISLCTFLSRVRDAHIDPACLRSLVNAPPLLFSFSSSFLSLSLLPLLAPTAFLSSLNLVQHLLDSSAVAGIAASLSQASISLAPRSSGAEQRASGIYTCSGQGLHHPVTSLWMELFGFWLMK